MTKKTNTELEAELDKIKCEKEERIISDRLYAIKLVEKIVFGFVGLILIAVATALIALVVRNK